MRWRLYRRTFQYLIILSPNKDLAKFYGLCLLQVPKHQMLIELANSIDALAITLECDQDVDR